MTFWNIRNILLIYLLILTVVADIVFYQKVIRDTNGVEQRFIDSQQITGNNYYQILKSQTHFSFVVCGDPHVSEDTGGYLDKIKFTDRLYDSDFMVITGDLSREGKGNEFEEFSNIRSKLYDSEIICFPAIGNHDLYNEGWEYYKKIIGPSTYAMTAGNCKFIFLDTADGKVGARQMYWLENELKSNNRPITFVVSHYPIYGGKHGIYQFPRNEEREKLISLFEKYQVDYVLEGHYHGYVHIEENGVNYVTSGSIGCGPLDNDTYHYLTFTVSGNHVSYRKVDIPVDEQPIYRENSQTI